MFEIKIISTPIAFEEIKTMAENQFGTMVKAVVDVEKDVMAVGGELHADEEAVLIANGSLQKNLWGINIYPDQTGGDRIEFDSMINIRPYLGNRSRDVENHEVRNKIIQIIKQLVKE
ncbi:MAG: DUF5674 family protein [Bacteroidia bacterium]